MRSPEGLKDADCVSVKKPFPAPHRSSVSRWGRLCRVSGVGSSRSGSRRPVAPMKSICSSRSQRFPCGFRSAASCGSGWLAFSASSMTFARHRVGLRGIPSLAGRSMHECTDRSGLLQLDPFFEALVPSRGSSPLLSWGSSTSPPDRPSRARPLLRFVPLSLAGSLPVPLRPDAASVQILFRLRGFAPP
jgi:hypothetical protein